MYQPSGYALCGSIIIESFVEVREFVQEYWEVNLCY